MKKTSLIFGALSGLVITTMMLVMVSRCYNNPRVESNDVVGYAGMIAAFAFVFLGIRHYREKQPGARISFGQAFKMGAIISFIASTMYVGVWLVDYYVFVPDFLDKYTAHVLYQARIDGATPAELQVKAAEMAEFNAMYDNPVMVILVSYMEVLPVGLVVSLFSALLLRRKGGGMQTAN